MNELHVPSCCLVWVGLCCVRCTLLTLCGECVFEISEQERLSSACRSCEEHRPARLDRVHHRLLAVTQQGLQDRSALLRLILAAHCSSRAKRGTTEWFAAAIGVSAPVSADQSG